MSWWMNSCYFPSWQHSPSARSHYTLLEMRDVFSTNAVLLLPIAVLQSPYSKLPHRPAPDTPKPSQGSSPGLLSAHITGLISAFRALIIHTWPLRMINTNIQVVNHNCTLQSTTVINLLFCSTKDLVFVTSYGIHLEMTLTYCAEYTNICERNGARPARRRTVKTERG